MNNKTLPPLLPIDSDREEYLESQQGILHFINDWNTTGEFSDEEWVEGGSEWLCQIIAEVWK